MKAWFMESPLKSWCWDVSVTWTLWSIYLGCNMRCFDHTNSVIAFWYTRITLISNETLLLPCSIALQRQSQCVLCGAYVGLIEGMRQTVCIDGLTETVAEGECWTFVAYISRWCCIYFAEWRCRCVRRVMNLSSAAMVTLGLPFLWRSSWEPV
jgi:hypothetical protein